MKVLHVIPSVAPRYGGPSQAVLDMCRALPRQGVDVLIATTDADGGGRLPVERGEVVPYQGVPSIFFPRQFSESLKYSRPLAFWLDRHIREFDVVNVHAVFSHACLAAAGACRRAGVPYVVRPLGTLDPWSLRQKSWRKRLMWHLGVKVMLRHAAAIHYTTAEERRLAEEALGLCRGVVIPLGIDETLLASSESATSFRKQHPALGPNPYVLVLSRLHPKKRIEQLLEVFQGLVRDLEFCDWRLVIAGDGEAAYVESLKQHVRGSGSEEHVIFTGWLKGDDKAAALRGAALLALPSHQENFGLSVVEALAFGVPVLVSTGVNLAEEIQAAGAGWVVPLDEGALLQALAKALRSPEERSRRGEAGRELALSRFTWPTIAANLADLYHSFS